MNYKPKASERDWKGVCIKCGHMKDTVLINLLENQNEKKKREKDLTKKREFYRYLGYSEYEIDEVLGTQDEPEGDWREVTSCCHSEDFIPEVYAQRCAKCHQWYDERRGCDCQTGAK